MKSLKYRSVRTVLFPTYIQFQPDRLIVLLCTELITASSTGAAEKRVFPPFFKPSSRTQYAHRGAESSDRLFSELPDSWKQTQLSFPRVITRRSRKGNGAALIHSCMLCNLSRSAPAPLPLHNARRLMHLHAETRPSMQNSLLYFCAYCLKSTYISSSGEKTVGIILSFLLGRCCLTWTQKYVHLQLISLLLPADSNIVFLTTSTSLQLLIHGHMDFTTASISSSQHFLDCRW